jgi:hypothetical protein
MSEEWKWVGWDKPVTVLSKMALEMRIPKEYLKLWMPGAFKFNDGTTQGWTIDQLYDTSDPNMTHITPYSDPISGQFYGFTLSNYQNLGLAATACPLLALGTKATSLDFYLDSPDLQANQGWKNRKGYSLDLQRNFLSLCADPPSYFAQLQVRVWDKQEGVMKTYGEWDDQAQKHIFHPIKACQPYHFVWTPAVFTDANLELRFLRIRLTQPNFTVPGAGECLPKGSWLVGNICPEV